MITLTQMGQNAKNAEQQLSQLSTIKKNQVLKAMAREVRKSSDAILKANAIDMQDAEKNGVKKVMLDRLKLDDDRIASMADGLEEVAGLADPIGEVLKGWTTETGLDISQVRVPLGVIGMIYEARPNVTVDAAGLTFKSGNAVILRGGKEAIHSNQALVTALRTALKTETIAEDSIQLITDTSHETATALMQLTAYLDVLIPRGSAKFIQMVVQKAKVPVIETGAGNCHVYVDEGADLQMATNIIVNAKTQRPSVCNAMEKLVVNEAVAEELLPMVAKALKPFNVDLRGDERAKSILPDISLATEEDWGTEYNDYIMAIKVVDDLDQAIDHINRYNTKHSEAIITNNYAHSEQFTKEIDAAVVYVNASTRFTDGYEFGFGAEIGISTQKLHARGPMGLNEITSTKYVIRGNGQVRK
ncbi:glutamate-5-semialdehyde dehydrogenase [Pediococcus parvulus]|jgi:glutamate-5-semialdehyde dehydrogenase|uniref:Gamma-glutamyl phosphate reductase n=1 Tax=Pediococcus parvulus TaxID=54062 RepID=A0AAP5TDK9_9LACO|nr:glutamate-5-semialdehyde dehydrogenase [Pediococcus parvulus]MCT3030840.1 glutamate-5-semialdehyde dehydrogenase [Pediococcus parvulus]MCT3034549.1 glutamate-5-semialdehyde dehydrogenase [Pediococcus parvulus]MDV7694104.1 glutamate-5-semialdehyde dehydrogenase [Pediococcus parvulus]OAD63502.1 glutamate-5-semialdehyde dehydrogenase [Pediococcus parvulus]